MSTPTMAPPGWYVDPSRPDQPRFWDGYQFRDQGVTICPDGHEAPMSAVFCPDCGAAVGAVRLAALTAATPRRRDDLVPSPTLPERAPGNSPGRSPRRRAARSHLRRHIERLSDSVRQLLGLWLTGPRSAARRDTGELSTPGRPSRAPAQPPGAAFAGPDDRALVALGVAVDGPLEQGRLVGPPPVSS
jgi:hypothetical protein